MNCCSNDTTIERQSYLIMENKTNTAYINEKPILLEKFASASDNLVF